MDLLVLLCSSACVNVTICSYAFCWLLSILLCNLTVFPSAHPVSAVLFICPGFSLFLRVVTFSSFFPYTLPTHVVTVNLLSVSYCRFLWLRRFRHKQRSCGFQLVCDWWETQQRFGGRISGGRRRRQHGSWAPL